jgi:hypothetical protein
LGLARIWVAERQAAFFHSYTGLTSLANIVHLIRAHVRMWRTWITKDKSLNRAWITSWTSVLNRRDRAVA